MAESPTAPKGDTIASLQADVWALRRECARLREENVQLRAKVDAEHARWLEADHLACYWKTLHAYDTGQRRNY